MVKCKNCKWSQYTIDENGDKLHWCPMVADSLDVKMDRYCDKFLRMSQGDKIRAMSDEELERFLKDFHRHPCSYCVSCKETCKVGILAWLKSEAKE